MTEWGALRTLWSQQEGGRIEKICPCGRQPMPKLSPWGCPRFLENPINSYIWCAVGALVGGLAGLMVGGSRTEMIESVLVGVFGAFLGGDFLATMLNGGVVNDKDFKIASLMYAVLGAFILLLVLRLMRRMVGPMKASKTRQRDRY